MTEVTEEDGNDAEGSDDAAARDGKKEVGSRGGDSPPYEDWTVEELQGRAKELALSGYSDMRKDELIELLRNH